MPIRLDLALIRLHPDLSRRRARDVVEKGQVTLAGRVVLEPGSLVEPEARIEWDPNSGYIALLHHDPWPEADRHSLTLSSELAHGKDYYSAPTYIMLLAAGAVVVERSLAKPSFVTRPKLRALLKAVSFAGPLTGAMLRSTTAIRTARPPVKLTAFAPLFARSRTSMATRPPASSVPWRGMSGTSSGRRAASPARSST